jgi:hypothetical protein
MVQVLIDAGIGIDELLADQPLSSRWESSNTCARC